ncbi:hypothetical protein D4A92_14065 [Rhizobium rosettiformans]|uniref:Ferrous iron transporter FeoA domain-containing protein n=1 Tax=Rhizobium rosettiformans TaxID=1368430 RepID=A0ABX7EYY6_9HYPH|nr:hypothetical protein D4A92_14065 [Rhizobium rosettiformans]
MDIEFPDRHLALIETESAAQTRLPVAVIQSARLRLSMIRAAPDVRTLKNWRSLGLSQGAPGSSEYFVSVSPEWVLSLRIEEVDNAMAVIVNSIEEKARGAA